MISYTTNRVCSLVAAYSSREQEFVSSNPEKATQDMTTFNKRHFRVKANTGQSGLRVRGG